MDICEYRFDIIIYVDYSIKINSRRKGKCMFKFNLFIVGFLFMTAFSLADDNLHLQGEWKLVSYEVEIQSNGQKIYPMGRNPNGYVIFTPDRDIFLFTAEGRMPAKTEAENAELLKTMLAYSGKYRIEGDSWITKIDIAWNPEWVGTEQKRSFKVDGDRLQVHTPWRIMPDWADKGMTRSIVTFERSK
jgi:hypothetical protein